MMTQRLELSSSELVALADHHVLELDSRGSPLTPLAFVELGGGTTPSEALAAAAAVDRLAMVVVGIGSGKLSDTDLDLAAVMDCNLVTSSGSV